MVRRWLTAVLGVACFGGVWLGGADRAAACSCMGPETTVVEVLRAGMIIAQGVPTEVREAPAEGAEAELYLRRIAYSFTVGKALNRGLPEEVTLFTEGNGAMCGVSLPIGREVMLVLHPEPDGTFYISLCNQLLVDSLAEDWRVLFDAMPEAR